MAIENREKELKNIYTDISNNRLVLPNFQRGFVWNREQQSRLLTSVLVGLPVGSLLVLEGRADDFSKRELCFPSELIIENDCDYVLDGQQRLSALRGMFYDIFDGSDWKETWSKVYGALRNRWFVVVKPGKDDDDVFGYQSLSFQSLSKYTDSDLQDCIKCLPIHKTKPGEVYHPGFVLKNDDGVVENREAFIVDHISSRYATECLVPLWQVCKSSGLHRKVLSKVANKRVEELKVEAEDSGHSLDFYVKVFSPNDVTRGDLELELDGVEGHDAITLKLAEKWAALSAQWVEKVSRELEGLPSRKMAIIHLNRDEVGRAVAIFEAINRGGVPLSTYDLIVAKSARDQGIKNLSSRILDSVDSYISVDKAIFSSFSNDFPEGVDAVWSARDMKVVEGNEPSNQFKDWFVNVLSLLVHVRSGGDTCTVDHIKREKVLALNSDEVNEHSGTAVVAIIRALAFLQLRCGVISSRDVSYKLMVVVLAFHLSEDSVWGSKSAIDKLEYWYWSSLFGGAYFYRQNERCVSDIQNLSQFISGNGNPFAILLEKILNVEDFVTKDMLLRKDEERETKSIRVSLIQFVLSKGPADFTLPDGGSSFDRLMAWSIARGDVEVEIHHIIPLAEASTIGESSKKIRKDQDSIMNSALNLAYISKRANRLLSNSSPSDYTKVIHHMASATNYLPDTEIFSTLLIDKNYVVAIEKRYDLLMSGIKNHMSNLC